MKPITKKETKSANDGINEEFLKAMKAISEKYWQQEVQETHTLFTLPDPDQSSWVYEDKKLASQIKHISLKDSAKLKKMSLLRQMALMMSQDFKEDVENTQTAVIELLKITQGRLNEPTTAAKKEEIKDNTKGPESSQPQERPTKRYKRWS